MIGWHRQLDGYEFEQALGVSDGQSSLTCCSPWVCKELDMTVRLHLTLPYKSVKVWGPCAIFCLSISDRHLDFTMLEIC